MTSEPEQHAGTGSASPVAETDSRRMNAEAATAVVSSNGAPEHIDADAMQVLLKASAAAESLQQRFEELQKRQVELANERSQLNADRETFERWAWQHAENLSKERAAHREATKELEARDQQIHQLQEELAQERATLQTSRESLETEREKMQAAIAEELEREREEVRRQQTTLDQQRKQLSDRMQELEQQHDERSRQVEEQLQSERGQMRETVRRELAAELDQMNREKHEWLEFRDAQKLELQEETENLQQQRELFGEQLESEQNRLREEIEKRRQMLLTEQNNLQRRYRFQFEHLARSREDFERELRQLRHEQQMFRASRKQFDEQHRLRFRQLERIRQLLLQREASLKREQKVVERSRLAERLDIERQRARLQEHQNAVVQDLRRRSREIAGQEDVFAQTARRLEERSQHLNQMRSELNGKQRDMLEQRLLLEEAQAALHRQAPEQQVQASIQQARNDLQQFFQQLHSDLKAEQQRLDQRIQELNEQQQMFRRDREDLERWFAEREQQIAASQPEAINSEYETRLAALQDEVVSVRKRWNADRTEAESTIRDLLDRLTAADARAFQTEPSLSDLTEMDPGLSPEDADSDLPNGADSPHTDAA